MHDRNHNEHNESKMVPTNSTASFQGRSDSTIPDEKDRARKAVRTHVILSGFWRDAGDPEEGSSMELSDWMDALVGVSADELRTAWAEYQRSGPRSSSGRLARPDPGALYRIAIKARATAAIINPPPRVQIGAPPPAPRMSKERMAEIMAETGYKDMPAPKAFPEVGDGHD